MNERSIPLIISQKKSGTIISDEIQTEIIRKAIHLSSAFVPVLAQLFGRTIIILLLLSGILVYTLAEFLRHRGKQIFCISRLTQLASRSQDEGHFVLGPVTLGIGIVLALMLYPEPAASVAIYALAFGDGLASLFGKVFGTITIPFTKGKSLEGSSTCFAAVFLSSFFILQNPAQALSIALFSTILETIPLKDFDNILLPTGAGLVAFVLLA
ncbi:MAG: diacylglycerol/polyprenol kinase family protein [Salinispira sp.]